MSEKAPIIVEMQQENTPARARRHVGHCTSKLAGVGGESRGGKSRLHWYETETYSRAYTPVPGSEQGVLVGDDDKSLHQANAR